MSINSRIFPICLRTALPSALGFALLSASASVSESVTIGLANHTDREIEAGFALRRVLNTYDLHKYTFTRQVIIQERAINHAFPVLTLNVFFRERPDDLLFTYVHEQLHWYLREHDGQQRAAVMDLQQIYPHVPVGLPESAESEYSSYAHLVDCYLEIEADRELMGAKRTERVIKDKPWYTWIYKTILHDEQKISDVVDEHHLRIK